ncbi:hypothetical protein K466DRAFT_662427 [Polyporus arcularius HHB13444]|uniref:MYND-type domain-containing protein n=1 Tax=Polyporus arcularius HHB13444 TaxID=1314778 RepID=A0A5C3PH02_9APHY|nr:hypothetical protein K466DRAFT_662427 [Polyporus arcularius HHB13444]
MGIESHPLQTTFRPGDTSELRNKEGRCRNCDRARKSGEQFMFCKGCKTAVYCSEQCQREHWKDHKDMCKFSRANAEILASHPGAVAAPGVAGMPDFIELQALLRVFSETHRASFQTMLLAKLFLDGGAEAILAAGQKICIVPLKYREPGPDGVVNPALTFSYTKMVFLPLDRVLADPQGTHSRLVDGWNVEIWKWQKWPTYSENVNWTRRESNHGSRHKFTSACVMPLHYAPITYFNTRPQPV